MARAGGARGRGGIRGGIDRNNISVKSKATSKVQRSDHLTESSNDSGNSSGLVDDRLDSDSESQLDDQHDQPISEDELPSNASYAALLRALNAKDDAKEPSRKKRKIEKRLPNESNAKVPVTPDRIDSQHPAPVQFERNPETATKESQESDEEEPEGEEAAGPAEEISEDDEESKHRFELHYGRSSDKELENLISIVQTNNWQNRTVEVGRSVRKAILSPPGQSISSTTSETYVLKRRLSVVGKNVLATFDSVLKDVFDEMANYRDISFGGRNASMSPRLRDGALLHALNHVFKTRDRVIKNNSKLAQQGDEIIPDLRDQGFTRPKVLIILPTREACVQWVESVVRLCEPEQQENKSRFLENFHSADEEAWQEKPLDFRELFAGNIDDNFRIGLKFTRKTVKFFSSFYNSDIILASALGLVQVLEGAGKKDRKKPSDADFLSSIEIAIIDNATAIQMQNWRHVESIFSRLNLLPTESHGCDFSRVRLWYLDGNAKYLRQTIIFSDFLTPDINYLLSHYTSNIAGRVKYTPTYRGAMLELAPNILPGTLTQTFLRFHSPNPSTDPSTRFTHFTTTVLPSLIKSHATKETLLFVPDYPSFLRLRNHLNSITSISFTSVSEYTASPDISRARSHFFTGRHPFLLTTERAHHFRRPRTLPGIQRAFFYGLPDNPIFYTEILAWIARERDRDDDKITTAAAAATTVAATGRAAGAGTIKVLFSKWDVMKLERIVGTERVGRLIAEGVGDVFEFT